MKRVQVVDQVGWIFEEGHLFDHPGILPKPLYQLREAAFVLGLIFEKNRWPGADLDG